MQNSLYDGVPFKIVLRIAHYYFVVIEVVKKCVLWKDIQLLAVAVDCYN